MSTQISVRLNDRVVAELDALVASGAAKSRADLVESALEAELRRRLYQRDAEIYRDQGEDPELAGMNDWLRDRTYPSLDD
ncbi:MAG: ribbon-helix-helix domain-containing protein [Knoellia sp.]